MKTRFWLLVVPGLLVMLVGRAVASEAYYEAWRSPFGFLVDVSVNSEDDSIWLTTYSGSLMHVSADGTVLLQVDDLAAYPSDIGHNYVSVNSTDGSCWVATTAHRVIHFAANGTVLWQGQGDEFADPRDISVNRSDGTCWVAVTQAVIHLGVDGKVLRRIEAAVTSPRSLSVNPADGSCWVADYSEGVFYPTNLVEHFNSNGALLSATEVAAPQRVSVDSHDGSCWVVGYEYTVTTPQQGITHLAADGSVIWSGPTGVEPHQLDWDIAANRTDGSCWVLGGMHEWGMVWWPSSSRFARLSALGEELWSGDGYGAGPIAANASDGSCWVIDRSVDTLHTRAVSHVGADGSLLLQTGGFDYPLWLSVDPNDGSCWVADWNAVVHMARDGSEMSRSEGFTMPVCVSVNTTDRSCWVANGEQVVHLGTDGAELWRGDGFEGAIAVSANSADGSCWVADAGQVIHLGADGAELWRGTGPVYACSVSVNSSDGSCWVADDDGNQVYHLASDGSQLWSGTFTRPVAVAVNATDGSCWLMEAKAEPGVHDNVYLVHLSSSGEELWRGHFENYVVYTHPTPSGWQTTGNVIAVNPVDGSCWAGIESGTAVVHVGAQGNVLWTSETLAYQGGIGIAVSPNDHSLWWTNTDACLVVRYVHPSFPDVTPDSWAFDEVEACVSTQIVAGYPDGWYHPDWPVNRGQMAVFVARGVAGGDENVPEPAADPGFTDVDSEHWAYKYIYYIADQNIVEGYPLGDYQPDEEVTRDQMAVYVARAMVAPTTSVLADYEPADPRNFPDVNSQHWAYLYVEYCVEHGIVSGYPDGTYRPATVVTREQMAVYVARAFGLL